MPPKAKFTKEEIINAALGIAREKGADVVTARNIAAKLNVSTRPIFTYFDTMDDLKAEMKKTAENIYAKYAKRGLTEKIPFYGFGKQYIRFAQEEPELYKLLFLTPPSEESEGVMSVMKYSQTIVCEAVQKIYNMNKETAKCYFRDMWLVVHSLATLIVTKRCPYSNEKMEAILTEFSVSICKAYKEIPGLIDGTFNRDDVFEELIKK